MTQEWTNSIKINGILFKKPKVENFKKGDKECSYCSFTITQVMEKVNHSNNEYFEIKKTFGVVTYSSEVIAMLNEIKNKCVLNCYATLEKNAKGGIYIRALKVEKTFEYQVALED